MNTPLPKFIVSNPLPFPYAALPPSILSVVAELHDNLQAPPELIFLSVMGAISHALQYTIDVERPGGRKGPVSLVTFIIAESGERKTTVDDMVNQAARDFEEAKKNESIVKIPQYEAEMLSWDIEKKTILSLIKKCIKKGESTEPLKEQLAQLLANQPKKPKKYKAIYNNASQEEIQFGLYEHHPSAYLLSNEGGIVTKGLALKNPAILNAAWDGATQTIDRRSTDSFVLKDTRMTASIMVQLNAFFEFANKNDGQVRESGLAARSLVAYPISTQGQRFLPYDVQQPRFHYLTHFHQSITEYLTKASDDIESGVTAKTVVTFNHEAKIRWTRAYNIIEELIAPGKMLSDVKDYASKMADNLARISALMQFFETGTTEITFDTVDRAAAICSWLMHEFKRLFSNDAVIPQEQIDAELLNNWLWTKAQTKRTLQLTKTYIRNFGPNSLRSKSMKSRFESALDYLAFQNRVAFVEVNKTTYVELNPYYFSFQSNQLLPYQPQY